MTRRRTTQFRRSQARLVLEGVVRSLAPHMQFGPGSVFDVVRELAHDTAWWAELEAELAQDIEVHGAASTPATSSVMTAPIASTPTEAP